MSEDEDDYASDVNRTPYYTQTERKFLDMITIQALKNLLHFLQETNGEMHMYLHNHITENPFRAQRDEVDGGLVDRSRGETVDAGERSAAFVRARAGDGRGGVEKGARDIAERFS